jgi:LytS/YehU family sensor histidine kinase
MRQREAKVEKQAIDFELERSEMARQALDARMRLLTAQAQPHFLFNTLANVQALVEAGSPRAPKLLQSLTDYLRAAVPRLDGSANTLGQELELVRAYLELMQMRMPDRLAFALHVGAGVQLLPCPPMTLLTLVENAVQHGIDPSEEGGRIDVHANLIEGGRCRLRVTDTGVGLRASGGGLGTGLAALRERLQWAYGGGARFDLTEVAPHGVQTTIEFAETP